MQDIVWSLKGVQRLIGLVFALSGRKTRCQTSGLGTLRWNNSTKTLRSAFLQRHESRQRGEVFYNFLRRTLSLLGIISKLEPWGVNRNHTKNHANLQHRSQAAGPCFSVLSVWLAWSSLVGPSWHKGTFADCICLSGSLLCLSSFLHWFHTLFPFFLHIIYLCFSPASSQARIPADNLGTPRRSQF